MQGERRQQYLVESYVPRLDEAEWRATAARARKAARELSHDVRYVRSLFVADDETCFHVLEGPSADVVGEVSRRAGIEPARIVAVTLDEGEETGLEHRLASVGEEGESS